MDDLHIIDASNMTYPMNSQNTEAARQRPDQFVCPSDTAQATVMEFGKPFESGVSSYAMNSGSRGMDGKLNKLPHSGITLGNTGPFIYEREITRGQIKDGLAHTFFVGEVYDGHLLVPGLVNNETSWSYGNRFESLRNTSNPLNTKPGMGHAYSKYVGPQNGAFQSRHPGGANFAFGDCHVVFVRDDISMPVYCALSTIDGQNPEYINCSDPKDHRDRDPTKGVKYDPANPTAIQDNLLDRDVHWVNNMLEPVSLDAAGF